jgi:hypoxanthine phosphoribosyltransferase
MAGGIQYEIPTWNQIYDMLLCQAQKIQATPYKPDILVGIARGGLVPARILVDLLETPQFAAIQIEFYVDIAQTRQDPLLKQALTIPVEGKKVLLVDDIADTGRSLKFAQTYLHTQGAAEVKTATLYLKPQSWTKPDFYEKQTSCWVIFPWDTKETLQKILQKQTDNRQASREIAKLVKAGLPKQLINKLLKTIQQETSECNTTLKNTADMSKSPATET